MKKLIPLIAIFFCTPAYAGQLPVYLSIGAGLTHVQDSNWNAEGIAGGTVNLDNNANVSAAIGTSPFPNVRTEFEVSYRKNNLSGGSVNGVGSGPASGDAETWGFLLNGYYDFLPGQKLRPYLSAGVGAAYDKGKLTNIDGLAVNASGSDTVFAYQVGLGASYQIMPQTALWAGYRFLGSDKPDFDGLKASYNADEFRAGIRFNF